MGRSVVVVRGSRDDTRPAPVAWITDGVFTAWTRISTLAWESATANSAPDRPWSGRVGWTGPIACSSAY
jgi:hypothetical protein